jgi:hypothetical protein
MTTPTTDSGSDKSARRLVCAAAIAQTVFFACVTYYVLAYVKRDGFELNAILPLALIFLVLVLPSLVLSLFRRASLLFPAVLSLFALAANYLIFSQIVSELWR